jgi:hypothetical protein
LIGDHRAFALLEQAAAQSPEISRKERSDMAAKASLAVRGQPTDGDISQTGLCALAGVGLGLSAVAATVAESPSVLLSACFVLDAAGASQCF